MFFALDFGLAASWLGLLGCRTGHRQSSRMFQVCLKEHACGSEGRSCSRPVWCIVQLTGLGPKVLGLQDPGPRTQPTCTPAARRPPSLVRKCVFQTLRQGPMALGRRGPALPFRSFSSPHTPFVLRLLGPRLLPFLPWVPQPVCSAPSQRTGRAPRGPRMQGQQRPVLLELTLTRCL